MPHHAYLPVHQHVRLQVAAQASCRADMAHMHAACLWLTSSQLLLWVPAALLEQTLQLCFQPIPVALVSPLANVCTCGTILFVPAVNIPYLDHAQKHFHPLAVTFVVTRITFPNTS